MIFHLLHNELWKSFITNSPPKILNNIPQLITQESNEQIIHFREEIYLHSGEQTSYQEKFSWNHNGVNINIKYMVVSDTLST